MISTFLSKKSMCIVSNWVNEAQDLMAVTKYDDLPNSLIPSIYIIYFYFERLDVERQIFLDTYLDTHIINFMICVSLQISFVSKVSKFDNQTRPRTQSRLVRDLCNFYIGHSAAAANVIRKYPRGVRILESKVYRIKVFDLFCWLICPFSSK